MINNPKDIAEILEALNKVTFKQLDKAITNADKEYEQIQNQYKKGIVNVSSIIETLIEKFKNDKYSLDIQQLQFLTQYFLIEKDFYINELDKKDKIIDYLLNELAKEEQEEEYKYEKPYLTDTETTITPETYIINENGGNENESIQEETIQTEFEEEKNSEESSKTETTFEEVADGEIREVPIINSEDNNEDDDLEIELLELTDEELEDFPDQPFDLYEGEQKEENRKLRNCHFRYEEMTGIDLLLEK